VLSCLLLETHYSLRITRNVPLVAALSLNSGGDPLYRGSQPELPRKFASFVTFFADGGYGGLMKNAPKA
jgi:hypothetical protein